MHWLFYSGGEWSFQLDAEWSFSPAANNGVLFNTRNIEQLVEVLEDVYQNNSKWVSMKGNCLQEARKYTPDNCIKVLGETLLVNRRLEELNLGNNHLTDLSMNILKTNYGKFEMNETDLEEYKKAEKERQDIIKQNTKLKASKKSELEVPFLDEMRNIDERFKF